MKLIIDIADDQYKAVQDGMWCGSLYEELKNGIPVEQCEDCIRREAVMHILDEVGGDFDSPREAVVPIDYIADMVSDLPSVTPQPKMGKWIYTGDYLTDGMLKCSECGFEHDVSERFSYCPNCGAKMQEVEE